MDPSEASNRRHRRQPFKKIRQPLCTVWRLTPTSTASEAAILIEDKWPSKIGTMIAYRASGEGEDETGGGGLAVVIDGSYKIGGAKMPLGSLLTRRLKLARYICAETIVSEHDGTPGECLEAAIGRLERAGLLLGSHGARRGLGPGSSTEGGGSDGDVLEMGRAA